MHVRRAFRRTLIATIVLSGCNAPVPSPAAVTIPAESSLGTPTPVPTAVPSPVQPAIPAFNLSIVPISRESGSVRAIASDGPTLIAAGSNGPVAAQVPSVWRSTDGGASWDGPATLTKNVGIATSLVRFNGMWLVAVGGHAGIQLFASGDGASWKEIDLPYVSSPEIPRLALVDAGVILFGDTGDTWLESADGKSWFRREVSFPPSSGPGDVVQSGNAVTVVGAEGSDPAAWRLVGERLARASVPPGPGNGEARLTAVAVGRDGSLVAVSRNGENSLSGASAWRSSDGLDWELAVNIPGSYGAFDLTSTRFGLIAVGIGSGGIYQSSDGATWTQVVPILGNASIVAVTPTSSGFAAVGGETSHGPWFAVIGH